MPIPIRRAAVLLLGIVLLPIAGGCWSAVELSDRTFANALCLDAGEEDGEVMLTIEFPLPNRVTTSMTSGGGKGNPYSSVTKTSASVIGALQQIQNDVTRKVSLSHTRVIVLGRKFAESRQRMEGLIDFLARVPTVHMNSLVFVTAGMAKDILTMTAVFEPTPDLILSKFTNTNAMLETRLLDLLRGSGDSYNAALPFLRLGEASMVSEGNKTKPWAGDAGTALISGSKLVGTLPQKLTWPIAWLTKELPMLMLDIPIGEEGQAVGAAIYGAKSKASLRFGRNGTFVFDITLKGYAELMNVPPDMKLYGPDELTRIEKAMNDYIRSTSLASLQATQEAQADVLSLGNRVAWRAPERWDRVKKEWPQVYRERTMLNVKSEVKLKEFGAIQDPLHVESG